MPRSAIILVKLALLLPVLMLFVALGVDVGLFYMQLAELQVAAEAAAVGAAHDLPDDPSSTAIRIAESNMPIAVHGTVLTPSQIDIGYWDGSSRSFVAGATPTNAVRVTAQKSAASGNPVRWLVGDILGLTPLDIRSQATAVLLPELPGGVSSRGSITMSGKATTGSYDARLGPYDYNSPGQNGDLTANQSISLTGSVRISGSLRADNISVGGNANVSGSSSTLRRPLSLPSVDTTEISFNNDNASLPPITKGNNTEPVLDADGNFLLNGNVDYSIPPGDYYFNDFSVGGQARLTVSGPTNIYLTGNLDTSGGNMVNSSQLPSNMRVLMEGGTARVNAGLKWYGLLYAPDTDVILNGNAEVFGAVVGDNVQSNGTAEIYFDESLTIGDLIPGIPKRSRIVQ